MVIIAAAGPGGFFSTSPALNDKISDMTALAASLAAVSIAIFLVFPAFRALVAMQGRPGFSEYMKTRRLFQGFSCLAVASVSFSLATLVGIIGWHWPSKAVLLGQEILCCAGMLLSIAAIWVVWRAAAESIGR